MSYAVVDTVYGIPLTNTVRQQIDQWRSQGDSRYTEGANSECGFVTLYSASGPSFGYCGVKLDRLKSYGNQKVNAVNMSPTREQIEEAHKKIEVIDPVLRALAGDVGVYFIWSDM